MLLYYVMVCVVLVGMLIDCVLFILYVLLMSWNVVVLVLVVLFSVISMLLFCML